MADPFEKHRVIGIRHTLRQLKNAGFVEDESYYPDEAVADVRNEILSTAQIWYKVGAKRGGIEVLEALLDGTLEVRTNAQGQREIIAHTDTVRWTKALRVRVGNERHRIDETEYVLTLEDLGFDV